MRTLSSFCGVIPPGCPAEHTTKAAAVESKQRVSLSQCNSWAARLSIFCKHLFILYPYFQCIEWKSLTVLFPCPMLFISSTHRRCQCAQREGFNSTLLFRNLRPRPAKPVNETLIICTPIIAMVPGLILFKAWQTS